MIVYSTKIIQFIGEVKFLIKTVLAKEIGLEVCKDYFYDRQGTFHPIHVVIFNNKNMLAYFSSNFLELGFHESLMFASKDQLLNIVRHELAHYMMFIEYGPYVPAHGSEFKLFCQRKNWGEEVSRATICLEQENVAAVKQEESAILRKIQKLMALSTSSNKNEAEQAMLKSRELLLKHNIEASSIGSQDDEKMILVRLLKQSKSDSKQEAIARILKTFFVVVVFNRVGGHSYLEVVGSPVNVEIAEYVTAYLDTALDNLWDQTKRTIGLKGVTAKNSFLRGVAKGYCDKIHQQNRQEGNATAQALMVIEKKLVEVSDMVYPRLVNTKSRRRHCESSWAMGQQAGRQLNIRPGIKGSEGSSGACLPFRG